MRNSAARPGTRGWWIWVAALVAGALPAWADAPVGGAVADASSGAPVAGAFVAVTGPAGRYGAVSDASGRYVVGPVAAGSYTVAAQAPGYAVARADVAVADAEVAQDVSLTASGARFEALGVYGGQIAGIAADGQPGVFYATTSVIPQVYRTVDYGGTWSPVTLRVDDGDDGLDGQSTAGSLAASGVPGELAVDLHGQVQYSKDFGVTWRAMSSPGETGPGAPPSSTQVFWGHAGTTNVLVVARPGRTLRADMDAAVPALAEQLPSYLSAADDRMWVANGADKAWVAVAGTAGTVNIFDLAENPPATVASSLPGTPAPPTFVRLGGARAAGVPPDALLVYSNAGGDRAVVATKSGGTAWTSVSPATSLPSGYPGGCGQMSQSIGAIAPQSGGADANATVSSCFVTKTGTGPLVFTPIAGINNNTGLVFDAGYDRVSDFVIVSGDGNRGLTKSAQELGGVPSFPQGAEAAAGTAPGSGGVAVHGFNVAVVKDSTFGPAGATQVATMLSPSGGGLGVASDDGGVTFATVVVKGGHSVDWWAGADGTSWLVFGHFGGGNLLTAVPDWTSATPPLGQPNVAGTSGADIGSSGNFNVNALRGIPGANTLFIGGVDDAGRGSVRRAELTAGTPPTIGGITDVGGPITGTVQALAYCPASGADASIADVLFAAVVTNPMGGATGQLLRVTGAASATPGPAAAAGDITAAVNDVRAHCGSGTVYVGTGSDAGGPSGALYKSTDGGLTFSAVPLGSVAGLPPSLNVRVVAVNPADADEVLIAGNSEGYVLRSTDGGATWTLVNDPRGGGRNFLSEGIGDLEIPPPASSLATSAVAPVVSASAALVGTGGGLFVASVRGDGGGGGGGSCQVAADCDDANACTTDACTGGTCTATEPAGVEGVRCELEALRRAAGCADAKLQRFVAKKIGKVDSLVTGAATAKAKKARRQLGAASRLLVAVERKAAKSARRGAMTGACGTAIAAQVGVVRQLVTGMAGA